MTIGNWLKLARKRVDALDAELILMFGLKDVFPEGVDRSYIFAHSEIELSQGELKKLNGMLERKATGEPLAYILGMREFYGREFSVGPEVLIPRPETESLVDLALEVVEEDGVLGDLGGARRGVSGKRLSDSGLEKTGLERAAGWQILEIGTGSGCIAITLDLEMAARGISGAVTAVDVSQAALSRAQENMAALGVSVGLLRSDLLSNVSRMEDFDVLVANLPYVDKEWKWLDSAALSFEPDAALYAEEKGLALYRRLFEELSERIPWVILEADPCQHEELMEIAKVNGYVVDKVMGYGVRFCRG